MHLLKILRCPQCKSRLTKKKRHLSCTNCGEKFPIYSTIPCFLSSNKNKRLQQSMIEYNHMHQSDFHRIKDGSYEILAAFAKGNKTVDIACGDGFIEELAPTTVGVEFSLNALKKARKNGARYLINASAEKLPFKDNAFDIAICAGSLEHFVDPARSIAEMGRVAKIQILTVHRYPPIPFAHLLFKAATYFLKIVHQPIEEPFDKKYLNSLLKRAGLSIIFEGTWRLPINSGRVIGWLPEIPIASCIFIIAYKSTPE